MIRLQWTRFLWTAAVAAALGLAAQAPAKPPDLPVNTNNTVTPDVLPDSEWDGKAPLPGDRVVPPTGNAEGCDLWYLPPEHAQGIVGFRAIKVFPLNATAMVGSPGAPLSVVVQSVSTTVPMLAHLPPVQRRQFASTLLFGMHPLLTLVPTDKLVDMACDHPPCGQPADALVLGFCPKCDGAIHGSIEIGFGIDSQGQATYKFHVVEFTDKGTVYTNDTMQGCVEALIRALNRDAHGDAEESGRDDKQPPPMCPYMGQPVPCHGWPLPQEDVFSFYLGLFDNTPTKNEPQLGVDAMASSLLKACHLALEAGRLDHAADLARQAYALAPKRVEADPVLSKLYELANIKTQHKGCCEK